MEMLKGNVTLHPTVAIKRCDSLKLVAALERFSKNLRW